MESVDAWVPFLAALAGAAVGGIANWLVMKQQGKNEAQVRAEEPAAERQDRYLATAASVIGEVTGLLVGLNPTRLSANFNRETSRSAYSELATQVEALRPRIVQSAVLAPNQLLNEH